MPAGPRNTLTRVSATVPRAPRRSPENLAKWQRRFDVPMLLVAALVIPSLLLTTPGTPQPWFAVGEVLNWFTWTAFFVELVVMLSVAPSRKQYLRDHPLDLVIVVLTPPFIRWAADSLRALRVLRALRLLRLAPLLRWVFSNEGVRYGALFVVLVAVTAGQAFSMMENTDYWDGVYWAITTMTTIGDQHLVPSTPESKVLAVLVMIVGIGFFATVTGAFAEQFLHRDVADLQEAEEEGADQDRELLAKVEALSAQVEDLRQTLAQRSTSTDVP